jgi:hypothetical protein
METVTLNLMPAATFHNELLRFNHRELKEHRTGGNFLGAKIRKNEVQLVRVNGTC